MTAWENLRSAISTSYGDLAAMIIIDNVPYLTHDLCETFNLLAWAVECEPVTPEYTRNKIDTIQEGIDALGEYAHDMGCNGRPGVENRIHCNMRRIVEALVAYEREVGHGSYMG